MKWDQLKHQSASAFKRFTGVRPHTFTEMVNAFGAHRLRIQRCPHRGRPPRLGYEDLVLMTLMYLREYRTLFHVGADFGLSEAMASRLVREVESVLVRHPTFRLPGKKALLTADAASGAVLVDASDSPIERPKKRNAGLTPAPRNGPPSKPNT